MKSKHLVVYKGQGIWKDSEKKLWGKGSGNDGVRESREIEFDGDREAFLANRPDIEFMVEYGQMTVTTVTIDPENTGDTLTNSDGNPPAGGVTINIG